MKKRLFAAVLAVSCMQASANEVRTFGPDSFRQIVAGEKGASFVVMLWSLDCAYCQVSFKALAEYGKKQPLKVVTIATDDGSDATVSREIASRLKSAGLASTAWAFGDAPPEQLRYAIDPRWRGELPRSYWFNARGEAFAHSGVITKELVEQMMGK